MQIAGSASSRQAPRLQQSKSCLEGGRRPSLNGSAAVPRHGAGSSDHIPIFTPKLYQLPRKVVTRSLEFLDSKDNPTMPGMMQETTLRAMATRFYRVFGRGNAKQGQDITEFVIQHLQRHTRRRRGESMLKQQILEWEQTSAVYEMFTADLNMFERVFFTVDVQESTSILSKCCSLFLVGMILCSIVLWMISTLPSVQEIPEDCPECAPEPWQFFVEMEKISIGCFTAEYLVKLLTVHSVRFELLQNDFLQHLLSGTGKFEFTGPVPSSTSCSSTLAGKDNPDIQKCDTQDVLRHAGPSGPILDGRIKCTLKHIVAPSNVIDLLAIMPFWLDVFLDGGGGGFLMVLRVLRLTRIFRVFKLGKYNDAFSLFKRVIEQSLPALLLMLFFIVLGLCLFGTLIWFSEQGTWYSPGDPKLEDMDITGRGAYLRWDGSNEPDGLEESPFPSIIHAFWYIIVTITTVGYGDVTPTTGMGKFFGSVTILCGIIVLAMPIGVVGSNFSNEYQRAQEGKKLRLKMKKQMEALTQVEQEQDAAIACIAEDEVSSTAECGNGPPPPGAIEGALASEVNRAESARQKILAMAQEMDKKWEDVLPKVLSTELTLSLRRFTGGLLLSKKSSDAKGSAAGLSRPVVPGIRLAELDALCNRVCLAYSAVTSFDEFAEFGLPEAREARRAWAVFVELCWEYTVVMCKTEPPPEPLKFAEMKRNRRPPGICALDVSQGRAEPPKDPGEHREESRPPSSMKPSSSPCRTPTEVPEPPLMGPPALPGMPDFLGSSVDSSLCQQVRARSAGSLQLAGLCQISGPQSSGQLQQVHQQVQPLTADKLGQASRAPSRPPAGSGGAAAELAAYQALLASPRDPRTGEFTGKAFSAARLPRNGTW